VVYLLQVIFLFGGKSFMNTLCDKCLIPSADRILSVYGALLCEECWDEYLCTPEGKVEYLIGIAKADYPASEFDPDFLCYAIFQWYKNRSQFDISEEEISQIENKLKRLKLL
jgi:hypothetical protein